MDFLQVRVADNSEAIVIAFDICSSSDIVEQFIKRGELHRYVTLLTKIKEYLAAQQVALQKTALFEPYKFTGDGWILLFPTTPESRQVVGPAVLRFMRELSVWYGRAFPTLIDEHLDTALPTPGITFGVDVGQIHHMKVFQRDEYVGRAIIVACRLQGAVKENDTSPEYKALVSNAAFNVFGDGVSGFNLRDDVRKLWNISLGKDFRCKNIKLI